MTSGACRTADRSAVGEIGGVDADLDLFDDAAAVRVLVLDRVLDRDDVPRLPQVDVLDERRERRCLAGARRTADEDETARQACEPFDVVREVQILETRDARRQGANRGGWPPPLTMEVHTEAAEAGRLNARFDGFAGAVAVQQAARDERQHRLLDSLGIQRLFRQSYQSAAGSHDWGRRRDQQQVAALGLAYRGEPRGGQVGVDRLGQGPARLPHREVELRDQLVEVVVVAHRGALLPACARGARVVVRTWAGAADDRACQASVRANLASIASTLSSRRWCRASPENLAARKAATISAATAEPMIRAPMQSTFMSSCSTA